MAAHILIVEDEPAIADAVNYALASEGCRTTWHATGEAALKALDEAVFDLAVLDVGLPDMNGYDLFREISRRQALPVIFLTARGGEIDRVVGLELGADDYISKPFSPRELCARVRMVLRRAGERQVRAAGGAAPAASAASGGAFAVDDVRKTIQYHGRRLELSRTEYRLLKVLLERPGRVFSRDELMQRAWDHPEVSMDRTVDAHIKQLRNKLRAAAAEGGGGDDADPIQTHRGLGYSFKERG